jgi:diaminopimelate decarboxylase
MSASAASLAGVRAPAVRSAAAKSASVTKRARVSARPARAARGVLQVAAAGDAAVESLQFLKPEEAKAVRDAFGTPAYVYDLARLEEQAEKALAFPNAFGLTVRYAMKASPNAAILKVFRKKGLNIDASSGYEVRRAVKAGFDYADISLSTQEFPDFFPELVERGLKVNACSLSQLEAFGEAFPGGEIGLRFNPGLGSGGTGKTNVGGPSSSFGIWHELLPEAKALCEKYELNVVRIHTHIGSGSDPAVWMKTSGMSLDLCREFPTVKTLNLGGGYKVGRMAYEKSTDLQIVGAPVKELFEAYKAETGTELRLEIEPGTFLLANSCAIVTTVQDKVTTGTDEGHVFLKLDAGMTEVLRPSLYAAQHPLVAVAADGTTPKTLAKYVVVGHCCESGDLLTPGPDDAESIAEREMGAVERGDMLVIEGAGAYCAGMSSKNYNSFPEAPEVMRGRDGTMHLIRKKQSLEQILENEVELADDAC